MIDHMLGDLVGTCCFAYMDVLVFSKGSQQLAEDLPKVLAALSQSGLRIKHSKCRFYKEQYSFLGNLVLLDEYYIDHTRHKLSQLLELPSTRPK